MFAKIFIERPVMAWVISIVILLFGLAALFNLPIAQYPEIAPPTVSVTANYPGASAKVVADTVAAPIEQQVNGVENMLYMSSTCTNDGAYSLTVTFDLGTDLNMAQVLVQNRVSLATPQLPDEVQRQGLNIKKRSPNILLVVSLYSPVNKDHPEYERDQLYMSNYATIQIKDEIARLNGVGDLTIFGQQDYSMRAWLDPNKLKTFGMTASEVVDAIREQNKQVATGQLGQEPALPGQAFNLTLSTLGRLETVNQFENIVVKTGTDSRQQGTDADQSDPGQIRPAVLLKDIARIELGSLSESISNTLDGRPSVGLAVFQLPGSNALDVKDRVVQKMEDLKKRFPPGLEYAIVYDTTPFITQSVEEVFHTLIEAIILVAIVVLLFLQDWKAMILPMIDVPVSLVGTLAVMYILGFSLNNLTLFGLVLAIGIVVDDAIVVLENVERWIAEGYDSKTATLKAMSEITGPIIAITLVLSSVFLPSALLPGITGQFYRQFALTIASAMAISAINAMTLTPSRAAAIFKGQGEGHGHRVTETLPWYGWAILGGGLSYYLLHKFLAPQLGLNPKSETPTSDAIRLGAAAVFILPGLAAGFLAGPVNAILRRFYGIFNALFDKITQAYTYSVAWLLRLALFILMVYGGLLALTYYDFTTTPVGFIPLQDKGYLIVSFQLPDSASVQRTRQVMAEIDAIALKTPGIAHSVGIAGNSIVMSANGSNFGSMFLILEDFDKRKDDPAKNGFQIMFNLQAEYRRKIQDAVVAVFPPPPVDGLGAAGGFKLMVEDRGNMGLDALDTQTEAVIAAAQKNPGVASAFSQFRSDVPQMYVDVDRVRCKQMGVPVESVFSTLQIYLGGQYVNDFNRFGRTWQVNIQADAPFRMDAEYVRNLYVRNNQQKMVPLGAVATIENASGPIFVQRYNLYQSAAINGNLRPGTSSGDGVKIMENAAASVLPRQTVVEWTELQFMQNREGNAVIFAFVGAVILVYLVLAAQYDNWTLPLSIILVVPMCLLCSIAGIRAVGLDMNIFVQVGFIVLVGLAAKNAILIVEFAEQQRKEHGLSVRDAALKACKLRLRPIVMTSFAFILGVVPLIFAEGAGAEMRKTLGIAVFSGMVGVTFFGVFLTPVFYYLIEYYLAGHKSATVTPPVDLPSPPAEKLPETKPPHSAGG